MKDSSRLLTIPAALQAAVERFGDRPAYLEVRGSERRTVSWSEIDGAARRLAAALVSRLGLQKGDRVAICAENGIDWLIALHGIALAGGVAVLVYTELKQAELRHQIDWAGCRFLVASRDVLEKLPDDLPALERVIVTGGGAPEGPFEAVSLKELYESPSGKGGSSPEPEPDDLAAIIYTSGTTGGAKGVMLSHRNFLADGHAILAALDVSEKDVLLAVLPLHHAMPFIACIVLPPLVGAFVVLENDLRRMRERLREERPTVFFGVPALFEVVYRNLLARAEAEGRLKTLLGWQKRLRLFKRLTGVNLAPVVFRQVHRALGGRLRFMFSGGAALNPRTALDFFSLGLPLLQGWGMSEAGPAIAVQRYYRRRFLFTRYYERHAGSVGEALPGVEVRLIDVAEKGIRVAEQGEGEVIVHGENVFRGYWNAPEATALALRSGWLHTGDLGRIDAGGNIYLTGRSKDIIVLESGEKVHPDELEAKLSESALIEDVCVLGRRRDDKTHVAAIIYPSVEGLQAEAAKARETPNEDQLRRLVTADVERLCRQLAPYKRVSRIELCDAPLPKTALRKVQRGRIAPEYAFSFDAWLATGASVEE